MAIIPSLNHVITLSILLLYLSNKPVNEAALGGSIYFFFSSPDFDHSGTLSLSTTILCWLLRALIFIWSVIAPLIFLWHHNWFGRALHERKHFYRLLRRTGGNFFYVFSSNPAKKNSILELDLLFRTIKSHCLLTSDADYVPLKEFISDDFLPRLEWYNPVISQLKFIRLLPQCTNTEQF